VTTRVLAAIWVAAGAVVLLAGCSDDAGDAGDLAAEGTSSTVSSATVEPTGTSDDPSGAPTATGENGSPGTALAGLPSFASIPSLRDAIVAAGLSCELEYEGLEDGDKVVSICVIAGEQALLTIWNDPTLLEELVTSGSATDAVVYGANWTIDLTTPQLASTVAGALGGRTG
jgi:hypothetical protein